MFLNGATGGSGGGDDLRTSIGGLGQLTFTPTNSKVTLAGSWGISILKNADTKPDFKTKNWLASGGIYYQATKSLKVGRRVQLRRDRRRQRRHRRQHVDRAGVRPDAVLLS